MAEGTTEIESGCAYLGKHEGHSRCVPRNTGSGPAVLWKPQGSTLAIEGWGVSFAFPVPGPWQEAAVFVLGRRTFQISAWSLYD